MAESPAGAAAVQVWAVANLKGGVGKTTTVATLGALLAQGGRRTLLVDLDPQGSLSHWFGFDPGIQAGGVHELFHAVLDGRAPADALVVPTAVRGLSLLPGSMALAGLERRAGVRPGLGLILRDGLSTLARGFDQVLVDCAPAVGVLTVNAVMAGDLLLIPVQTEPLALNGLERLLALMHMINRSRGVEVPFVVVPTLFDRRVGAARASLAALRARHRAHLWDGVIPVDAQLREASRAGVSPPLHGVPGRGVAAYRDLLAALAAGGEVAQSAPLR
jgi:chromosome partitioning protein